MRFYDRIYNETMSHDKRWSCSGYGGCGYDNHWQVQSVDYVSGCAVNATHGVF